MSHANFTEIVPQLHHADEETARQLVEVVASGVGEDEANVFADTGWFALEYTRTPTTNDLAMLQQNVGDAGALVRIVHHLVSRILAYIPLTLSFCRTHRLIGTRLWTLPWYRNSHSNQATEREPQ